MRTIQPKIVLCYYYCIKWVFFLFSFSSFTVGYHGFRLKKLNIIQLIFELACERKFCGEQ